MAASLPLGAPRLGKLTALRSLSRVAIAVPDFRSSPAWVPPAIALAWIGTLTAAAEFGTIAYAIPFLAAAAVVLALTFLKAAHGRPYAICCVLVFVVFALSLNFRVRDLGDVGLDWQNGVKLATWIVLAVIAVARWRRIAPLLREPVLALAFLYAMIAFASTAWSEVPAYTGANAVGLFAYLGLGCILIVDLGEDATIRIMLWTLLAYIAVGMIGGVVAPDLAWLPPSFPEETTFRLQGFSGHPNVFAQEDGVFMVLAMVARRKGLIGRAVFWGMFLLGVTMILAAHSRTTLVAVLIASGLVMVRNSRFGGAVAFAATGALALALSLAACDALPNIEGLFGELSRTGRQSEIWTLTGRTDIWEVVWTKIQEKPLFGWGFNGTEALISSSFDKSFAGSPVNAHNALLQSLLSVGFLGSLPAFAFIFLLIGRFVTHPDPARDQIAAYLIVIGMGEVEIFSTPVLLTLLASWMLAREAAKRLPSVGSSFEPVVEGAAHSSVGLAN
jgi:O-antigen ligase